MRRFAPALVFLVSGISMLAAACERRIEEPVPTRPALDATALQGKQAQTVEAAAPHRCMRPTPETPKRSAPPSPDPRCPPDPETPPKLRMAKVSFPEAHSEKVEVEVAEDDRTRSRGLMYRKSMPEDHGMIFVFDYKEEHSFWMHNTCIPLDMLFIDDDGFILGIEENTPTLSDNTFSVGCPSKYVLELNAGWTRAHGVKAGQKVALQGL